MDDSPIVFYNGTYHILYPTQKRGVDDVYGNLEEYANMAMLRIEQLIGTDGVTYSPDGRYAMICNNRFTLLLMKMFIDPILIDLSDGTMFLTAAYDNKPVKPESGAVTSACFSSDNQYFYYYLYGSTGDTNSTLFRYHLQTGETQLCFSGIEDLYYPRLSETTEGDLLILRDVRKAKDFAGIVRLSNEQDEWSAEQYLFDMPMGLWRTDRMEYSPDSGYAVLAGTVSNINGLYYGFMCVKADEDMAGLNRYAVISAEDGQLQILSGEGLYGIMESQEQESPVLLPYEMIVDLHLSPDGEYVLLHTWKNAGTQESGESTAHLYLVRLRDFVMKEVTGIDPAEIPVDRKLTSYQPVIEWNTDTLIIAVNDEIRTFRFR